MDMFRRAYEWKNAAHQLNHETRVCPKPCPVNRPTPANSPNLASNISTLIEFFSVASTL